MSPDGIPSTLPAAADVSEANSATKRNSVTEGQGQGGAGAGFDRWYRYGVRRLYGGVVKTGVDDRARWVVRGKSIVEEEGLCKSIVEKGLVTPFLLLQEALSRGFPFSAWPLLRLAIKENIKAVDNSKEFSLDLQQFSALVDIVGFGKKTMKKSNAEKRIAFMTLGPNDEILCQEVPVLPQEIHELCTLLGALTWYGISDREKRGTVPEASVVELLSKFSFAGGKLFGAIQLAIVKSTLDACRSGGMRDTIGGVLAAVIPCFQELEMSCRAALAMIPMDLLAVYPKQSDIVKFIAGKSFALLLPVGDQGRRMLSALAGLMNVSMKLTETSHRDGNSKDLCYRCNRSGTSGALPPSGMSKKPCSNYVTSEHPAAGDAGELRSSSDDSLSEDGNADTAACTASLDLPNVAGEFAEELLHASNVLQMVRDKKTNSTLSTIREPVRLGCAYRWKLTMPTLPTTPAGGKNSVQLLMLLIVTPQAGHNHATDNVSHLRSLPYPISLSNSMIHAVLSGNNQPRKSAKAHLMEVSMQEPKILMDVLVCGGAILAVRLSTQLGACLGSPKILNQYHHGWKQSINDLKSCSRNLYAEASDTLNKATYRGIDIGPQDHFCYCRVQFHETGTEAVTCRASGCFGGTYHADCLKTRMPSIDIEVAKVDSFFRCITCIEDGRFVPYKEVDVIATAAIMEQQLAPAAIQQQQLRVDDEENKETIRSAAALLGLPLVLTGHCFDLRRKAFHNIMASIRRALRDGNVVGNDFLKVLQEYKNMAGYHVLLDFKFSDDGSLLQLHFICMAPQQLDLLNKYPSAFHLQFSDQTFNTTRTAIQLGAITVIVPSAGGFAVPVAWTAWLPGRALSDDKIAKDKTSFFEKCNLFAHNLYRDGFLLVQPCVRGMVTDKDKAAVNGSLLARKAILKHNKPVYEEVLACLEVAKLGATEHDINAALVLISSLPMFVREDGSLPKHDAMPIERNELFSKFPSTSPTCAAALTTDAAAAFALLFRPTWLDGWGPGVMRGLAHHVSAALVRCNKLLTDAKNHGMWNIAAMQLLWLESPSAPNRPLSKYILQACLAFALLCLWHAKVSSPPSLELRAHPPVVLRAHPSLVLRAHPPLVLRGHRCCSVLTLGTPWSPLVLRGHPWYSVVTLCTPLSPLVLRGHPWYSMLMHRFRYSVLYLPSTHPRYSVLSPRPIISLPLLGTSSSPYCQLTPVLHPFPHAKVAIEKAVSSHIIMQDSELRRYALNCFYKVLSGTMPWEEYKTIWSMEEKWIKYLNDNWVCEQWWSLINAPMRKLMNTLWKDCDNESENLFAVLKGENDRTSDMRALLERLIGPPAISGISCASITGLKLSDLDDILQHKDKFGRFKRRDQTYTVVEALLERWVESVQKNANGVGAVKERFFALDSNDPLRNCTVGLQTGGMCLSMAVPAAAASGQLALMAPAATDAVRLANMNKSAKNMSKDEHGLLGSHIPIANAKNIDRGTGKNADANARILRAVQVAKDAAVFKLQLLDASSSDSISNLATYTADLAADAPEFNALYSVRRDVLLNRIKSELQYATNDMVKSLSMMCLLAPKAVTSSSVSSGISAACSNQELRKILLTAHPALSRSNFKEIDSDDHPHLVVPHFGLIYIIVITMRAQDWYTECSRVMGGDVQSLQFRGPLSIGYLIALHSVYSMCSSLLSSGLGSNNVSAFYVGQELRNVQSSTRLGRMEEHGTSAGSSNIQELWFISSKKNDKGFMCMPLGNVSVEKRILAFLPPNAVTVNTMEAALLLMLLAIPGMVSLNDSPPGQNERFLQPSFNSPAQMHEVCSMYLTSLGGISVANSKAVCEVTMPWLRRALQGVEWLLRAGLFKNDSGTLIAPALFLPLGFPPSFSVSQCIDALLGGGYRPARAK